MKFKLSYKIFAAFALTSLLVVALMVGLIRFYVARNFVDYANKSLLERYSGITAVLAAEYETNRGWQALKEKSEAWAQILQSGLPASDYDFRRRDQKSSEFENQGSDSNGKDLPSRRETRRIQRLARRLALFDADKHHIAGGRDGASYDRYTLQAIEVDGRTVGWLGLYKRKHLASPLEVGFLKQQSQMLYIIGAGILLLAAIVTFLLSRNLLSPVRKLAAGTRTLASRQFDSRIEVESKDELGQLAEDFNAMARTLEKYERMRRQWISDIAHELRTPLSILRGEIEALKDGIRKVNHKSLDSLYSEVQHLNKIVKDLHELSLADTGSLSVKKEPVDPVAVLNETLGRFQKSFAENQITIENELETQPPITIIGDADRLAQLFANLLDNALRYVDAPGTLKIGQDSKASRLILFFEDSGPGVPEKALERLFDRLYRVERSRSRKRGGSGLGLSICKSIVTALDGTIRAARSESGGLRIEVELPLAHF